MIDLIERTRLNGNIHARINERGNVPARKRATADKRYCPPRYVRNTAQDKEGYGATYTLRTAGEIVEITSEVSRAHKGYEKDRGKGFRGQVREFSQKSRRRLAKVCAAISWGSFPFLFVTLTYPAEFASDGKVCAAHLHHFRMMWERQYGRPLAVWKREYQRRGAVHFHLAILRPSASIPLEVIQRWVSRAWWQVVGSGDGDHLRAGTSVEVLRKPPVAYFSSHGLHGRDKKGYQNEVPEGFKNPGRFWGVWNLAPDWNEVDLSPGEFVEARRIMRAWARSKRLRQRANGGRVQGMWLRTRHAPGYQLGAEFLRATRLAVT